ncbi:MAG: hypothetical protein H6943_08140 [Zoogloeaceae bacterium]|nr:hypothetical protein [Zoogloeaceae bacterium]
MLQIELNVADIPAVFKRFADVIGERAWTHRARQMKGAIKGNSFLASFLHEENDIAFTLDRCGLLIAKYGQLPEIGEAVRLLYPAVSFAAQTLSMMDMTTKIEAERLRSRVRGAFANPDAMRAYRLELTVATHFVRRGWGIAWPEMMGRGETFDLLATSPKGRELEVECKSISNNKGRNIHRREALDFHQLVERELTPLRKTLEVGLAVILTVPKKLPTRVADRQALAKRILTRIHAGSGSRLDDGSDIRITQFDPKLVAHAVRTRDAGDLRSLVEALTGTINRESLLIGTGKGAIVFVVQSAAEDGFMDETFKTLDDAARRQLTRRRAGILIAGFDGLDGEQLISIAGQDNDPQQHPTALAIGVSRFLSSKSRDHVVGVGFLSRSSLRPMTPGVMDSGGAAYYFARRDSSMCHEDFDHLFSWRLVPATE